MHQELQNIKLQAEEIDDVAGSIPKPLDEEFVIELLKGNKFRFSLDNYQAYSADSRKITEQILKFESFDFDESFNTISEHLKEHSEPQYRSVFIMRLIQVGIECVRPKEAADLIKELFQEDLITK